MTTYIYDYKQNHIVFSWSHILRKYTTFLSVAGLNFAIRSPARKQQ